MNEFTPLGPDKLNEKLNSFKQKDVSGMNIYQRIQLVSNELKNIEKNMQVGKGNFSYKAVADQDVTLAVKEAETKYGIVSVPIKQELVKSEIIKIQKDTGGESIMHADTVKMTIRIINVDNPQEYIEVESFGRGLDPGDKGFGKAATYARKYGLLNAYKIATGEDPDKDKSKEMTAISVDQKRDAVIGYLMSDNNYCRNILGYFSKGSVDELDKKEIESIFINIQKKGKL